MAFYLDKAVISAPVLMIEANGPTSGNGNGGTIYLGSKGFSLGGSSTATISANAASNGTGNAIESAPTGNNPKAITFYPGPVNIDLGTASGQYTFSATGGELGGTGGTIVISAASATLKSVNAMNASALGGDSNGGDIYFYNNITSVTSGATVSASGHGAGDGGTFTAFYQGTQSSFDINAVITVDGGSSISTSGFDGSITINTATCQQWYLGASWPNSYWNCGANPGNPTPADMAPSQFGQSASLNSIRSSFGTNKVVLSVSVDANKYDAYWNTNIPNGLANGGWSFPAFTAGGRIYSTPFENANNYKGVYTSFTVQQVKESTAHELGHAADFINSDSGSGTYLKYIKNDYTHLDGAGLPCSTAQTQPFDNVIDSSTNMSFCAAVGTNGYTQVPGSNPAIAIESQYVQNGQLLANSTIAQNSSPIFAAEPGPYPELYAQSFAYQSFIVPNNIQNGYVQTTADGLFKNGYFACAQYQASYRLGGNLQLPQYCSN